jgi:aminopeptidase N
LRWTSGLETVLAHEIAHMWFGDLVSAKNWNDIWFKEGAATWSEALWEVERFQNENRYFQVMRSKAVNYFQNPVLFTKPIYGNPASIIFTNPYVFLTYNKASWIYHQLNMLLGQELNLSILRNLLNHFKFGNIDVYEFKSFYIEQTQDLELDFDIELFFEQWLFGAGHPQYDCQVSRAEIENDDDEILYDVQLTLTQTQDLENVAEVFKMPIYITFLKRQSNNQYISVYSERVINDQKVQEYSFFNVPDFDICKVDTLRTLCQNINIVLTNIKEITDKNKISVFPNPAIHQSFVYVSKPTVDNFRTAGISDSEIEITNVLGIKVDISSLELADKYQIDISKLPTGLYFVRFGNQTEKFTVVR